VILLDACTTFCTTLSQTIGPTLTEIIMFGALAALGWWRARKAISKVEAKADAGIAAANERASSAKAEARSAHVQLAEIRGSLRPAAPIPTPLIPTALGSSESGNFERVVMPELGVGVPKPRPSMPDPSLVDEDGHTTFPRPSAVPSFERETPAERPSKKEP